MDVKGKYVLVFGAGKSGIGAAGLLLHEQAKVILYDGNAKQDPEEIRRKLDAKAKKEMRAKYADNLKSRALIRYYF